MRLHLVNLPHTQINKDYVSCAYSQRNYKFLHMMDSIEYEIFSYAGEHSDAPAEEHVVIASDADQKRWFGDFDYHQDFFPITWGPNDTHWVESNAKAIEEISKRIQPQDIICVTAGICQKAIADAFPSHITIEVGVGYTGTFAKYRVFESYAHMHYVYGSLHDDNGKFFDAVIPNFFDPDDFYIGNKEDYFVFLGRFIPRKGVEIAVEATRRLGVPLVLAGQGAVQEGTTVRSSDGSGFSVSGDHITHIGHVDVMQRADLLAKAKGCFMPTTYLEPFGGVSIEALLSGTPVVASDFGAFSENIVQNVAGYRFRNMGEATRGAERIMNGELEPEWVRDYAVNNFSMDRIKWLYDDYFSQLLTLWGEPNAPDDDYRYDGFYSQWYGMDDRYERVL